MGLNKQVFINNWASTIDNVSIGPADVSIDIPALDSAALGPLLSNEYIVATLSDGSSLEIIHITGNDLVGGLTVERAKEGTAGLTLVQGDAIECRNTAGIYGNMVQKYAPFEVETKTDDYSITTLDFGKVLRMNAAVTKTLSLPSVGNIDDGAVVHAEKQGAGRLVLDAADSDYIHDSAAGGTIYSDDAYAAISLRYNHATTRWVIIAAVGAWTTT